MDTLLPDDELDKLEQIPLEERATALEGVERRLRSFMEDGSSANHQEPKE
ncbi:MAG TPA: hypothetical protein VGW79_03345 [Actinomycetota bacterium]|nr:hypothetical protein [Actinomycetota bacterium]